MTALGIACLAAAWTGLRKPSLRPRLKRCGAAIAIADEARKELKERRKRKQKKEPANDEHADEAKPAKLTKANALHHIWWGGITTSSTLVSEPSTTLAGSRGKCHA